MKLQASCAQDLADLARMLEWAEEDDLKQVRSVVTTYQPDASEDLESLIQLGKMERLRSDRKDKHTG